MQQTKEQVLAAALWSFVERLRDEAEPGAAGLDGLKPDDLEELAALLHTASGLRLALDPSPDLTSTQASARIQAAIAERRRQVDARASGSRTGRRGSGPGSVGGLLRNWGMAGAVAAALIAGIGIGRSVPALSSGAVPVHAHRLSHREACRLVPDLVAGRLPDDDSHAVLRHLADCAECFRKYRERQSSQSARPVNNRILARHPR